MSQSWLQGFTLAQFEKMTFQVWTPGSVNSSNKRVTCNDMFPRQLQLTASVYNAVLPFKAPKLRRPGLS